MADYSKFLFDAFSGPGQAVSERRQENRANMESDRNYARQLGLDDWRKQTDERDYNRLVTRDKVGDSQWERGFGLQQRTANRLEAAASRPNIETFYDPDTGREVKGYYDPQSPTGFRAVGGMKNPTMNMPGGYQSAPGGTMTFVPGGPADPAVVAQLAGARGQGGGNRMLPAMTIKDLGTKGQAVDDLNRLNEGFQDGYGGYKVGFFGDTANAIGRNYGMGLGDQSGWWQDYQSRKNVIRNQLFGSALTAHEKGEFDKADINPGMTPEAIRKNLARQHDLATKAARKLASAWAVQGYNREAIEAALGMSLDDIDGSPGGGGQQQPSYQTQDIEAEMRRRGIM
ncbi:MAG: hypothetical protein P0Y66_02530 [Candidatus Kaistia colombiensis]|nr:MAG: hypothetical protein P0Y66_02530 [Kaistia sp.]